MTELDSLTEPLVHLFLRLDAAMPTDPVLRAAAGHWTEKRQGKVMPSHQDISQLPAFILPHAIYAQLAINGDRHWIVTLAGSSAKISLGIAGHEPSEIADKRMAVRMRHLFNLVAEKAEPYAVMFEVPGEAGRKQLVEVYAAPLATPEPSEHQIFAVINSRVEAHR
jgi:hypothetical protein